MALPTSADPEDDRIQESYDKQFQPTSAKLSDAESSAVGNQASDNSTTSDHLGSGINAARDMLAGKETDPTKAVTHTNSTTPQIPTNKAQLAKMLMKKGSPAGIVAGILLLIGGGLGVVIPGSVLLNLKENLTLHWDQQNITSEIRSRAIITRRLSSDTTNPVCSTVKLACRYSKPSNKMLDDLDKAGIKAVKADGTIIDRQRFLAGERPAFYAYDQGLDEAAIKKAIQSGDTASAKLISATDFGKELTNNAAFRNAFRRAYNPRWVNWTDDAALKFMQKLGLSKAIDKTISEAADSNKLNQALADVVDGRSSALGATDDAAEAALKEMATVETEKFAKTATHEISSKGNAALTAVSSVCVSVQAPGVFSTVIRNFRMMQMAAVVFPTIFVVADAIKSGNGTPKMAENTGTLLTSRPAITDSTGKQTLGKSAMESGAILYGLLGDRGSAQQSKTVKKYIPGNIGLPSGLSQLAIFGQSKPVKDACSAASSTEAQVAVAALEATNPAGWVMLGVSLGVLILDKTGVLEKLLTPIIEGIVTNISSIVDWKAILSMITGPFMDDAKYEQFGDMVGVLSSVLASKANSVGNLPLTPTEKVVFDEQITKPVQLAWAQEDRLNHSPLDAGNPNTLLGSMVTQLIPYYHSNGSIFDNVSSMLGYVAKSPSSLLSAPAHAETINDWSSQCPVEADYAIAVSGAASGPLCDVQYGVPANYMGTDPVEVIKVLHDNKQIDDNGDIIAGSDFENWTQLCNTGSTYSLAECQVGSGDKAELHAYMALYQVDKQLADGMDNPPATQESVQNTADSFASAPTATGTVIDGDDYKIDSTTYAWGTRQCVDFVLYRLVKHHAIPGIMPLGNGKDVVGTLGGKGFKVDTTPALHAVMSTPVTSQPQYGHTAMVAGVNADGSFVVEEYNYTRTLQYDTRTIPASDIASKKITFAHTETKYQ